jgi:hypothetical protein
MRDAIKTYSAKLRRSFEQELCFADPEQAFFANEGELGVVRLAAETFAYSTELGYAFETAVMAAPGGEARLFFVRIDAWDPAYRAQNPQVDYCIPLAHDGASKRERMRSEIPFGGAWSDTWEAALVVFDERWRGWLRRINGQLAFANPDGVSAALFRLQERNQRDLAAFLG